MTSKSSGLNRNQMALKELASKARRGLSQINIQLIFICKGANHVQRRLKNLNNSKAQVRLSVCRG